ncbi:MAG: radical SAM protein [Magnetococcales bacterium]|nr:radical SAM protein [Magnetococcales bacterium]
MTAPRPNPLAAVYDAANRGTPAEKLAALPPLPRFIDLELTNTCNFRCLMCPTGTHLQQRKSGFMSRAVFERLLDQVRGPRIPLRFIRWGEPTLHQRFLEFLTAAKATGLTCHLNTNGSHLEADLLAALVALPLDAIKFSFQGVDPRSYREMRNTDFFDELLERIRTLHRLRGTGPAPFIQVSTTITYETREQVARFRAQVAPWADQVTVGRTLLSHLEVDRMKCSPAEKQTILWLQGQESVKKTHKKCPEIFDKLSVNWDGTVSACCGDYNNQMVVGDLMREDLAAVWHGPAITHYRTLLAAMRHQELPLCRTCYDYMGLETPGLQGTE